MSRARCAILPARTVWVEFYAVLAEARGGEPPAFDPSHPLGCHRRRLAAWATLGIAQRAHAVALRGYDLIIGLELDDVPVDGCITKAPCGGDKAGPSPVDRRKSGPKRSTATDGHGIPLGMASAGANRHDSPLPAPTLAAACTQVGPMPEAPTAHLDAAHDSGPTSPPRSSSSDDSSNAPAAATDGRPGPPPRD